MIVEPGEVFEFPSTHLYMIDAAPDACMNGSWTPVRDATWEFVVPQTYGTVSGTITDVDSGLPVSNTVVTVTGTTDSGVVSELVPVDANGVYTSPHSYLTDSEVTVTASGAGYIDTTRTISVQEGGNAINLSLAAVPVPTLGVSGVVLDAETDARIANASVVISGTDNLGNPVTDTVVSNGSGEFISTVQFKVGTPVTFDATAEGYESAQINLEAVSEEQSFAVIQLTPVVVDEPTATPSPDATPDQTATVAPTPSETPTTRAPAETPAPTTPSGTPSPTAPTETPAPTAPTETPAPTAQAITTLPATGTGSGSSMVLVVSGLLSLALVTVLGAHIARSGRQHNR